MGRFVAGLVTVFGLVAVLPVAIDARSADGRYKSTTRVNFVDGGMPASEKAKGKLGVKGTAVKGKLKEVGGGCVHRYKLEFKRNARFDKRNKSVNLGTITRRCGVDKRTFHLYDNNGSYKIKENRRGEVTLNAKLFTIQVEGADTGEDRTERIRGRL